jgi:hypothetical protein
MPVEVLKFNLGLLDREEALAELDAISRWLDVESERYSYKLGPETKVFASKLVFNRSEHGLELQSVEIQKRESVQFAVNAVDGCHEDLVIVSKQRLWLPWQSCRQLPGHVLEFLDVDALNKCGQRFAVT